MWILHNIVQDKRASVLTAGTILYSNHKPGELMILDFLCEPVIIRATRHNALLSMTL